MSGSFWTESTEKTYDNYTRALFGGFAKKDGVPRVLSEDYDDADNPDFSNLLYGDLPIELVNEKVWDFGALRAAMFAYNSSSSNNGRGEGRSIRSDIVSQDDARVSGGTKEEKGVLYIRGPYWWAVKNTIETPAGFGIPSKDATLMDYRDPTTATGRSLDTRIQLTDDPDTPVTLAGLIKQLTENTTVFGGDTVQLSQIFGTDGLNRYQTIWDKLLEANWLTTAIDQNLITTPTPLTAQEATAPTVAAPSAISAYEAEAASVSAPAAPTAGVIAAPPSVEYGELGDVDAADPGTVDGYATLTADTTLGLAKTDIDVVGSEPSQSNITVAAPEVSSTDIEPDDPVASYTSWTFTSGDVTDLLGSLPTLAAPTSIAAPTQQSASAAIDAAVAAFTVQAGLRYAAELAKLRRSLATSRKSMTSAFDRAQAILTAQKEAQIEEYDKSLRVEEAKANLGAAVSYEEMLLHRNQRNAELDLEQRTSLERLKQDYYRAISGLTGQFQELALRDKQFKTEIDSRIKQAIASAWLQYNLAVGDLTLKASTAQAGNYLQSEDTKARLTTQAAQATAENYTRALLASAENLLRKGISDAEATTRVNLANSDREAQLLIATAQNLTQAGLASADHTVRGNIAGAENITRASLANAENVLRTLITVAENITRVSLANADAATRASMASAENSVRVALANAENTLRARLANQDVATRISLANQDSIIRIALANQDIEFRRLGLNNQRILDEMNMRVNVGRMIYDVTLGWMSAKTSNAGALSNVLTAAMQKHTQEMDSTRRFDMDSETHRWQILMQRANLLSGLAEMKWRSQIQNLTVMQQTLASLGQATGTQHHPSPYQNIAQVVGLGADLISTAINLGVALA